MTGTTETRGRTTAWTARPRGRIAPMLLLRLGLWSVLHALFYFLQQLAELLAPLLLVAGLGWWALPHVVGAITTEAGNGDSQMHDILNTISGTIPAGLHLAGHWITPASLIFDGLLLMAFAAIGATLSALAARGM
jgi:hypothetical protein